MCKILRGAALDKKLKKMHEGKRFQLDHETFVSYAKQVVAALRNDFKTQDKVLEALDCGFLHPFFIRNAVKIEVLYP